MLVLARKVHDLRHFGLCHLVWEDAANSDAAAMYMQHNFRRLLGVHTEEPFQDMHDEFHGRVIVIQHEHLIHRRLFGLRTRLNDDTGITAAVVVAIIVFILIAHPNFKTIQHHLYNIGFAG